MTSPSKDFFLPVYIINLKERTERRAHIEGQFENRSEFELIWIDAISHPIGAVGLWQSMVHAVKMAVERDDDIMIICEDDHEFTSAYSQEYLFSSIAAAYEQGTELLSGGIHGFGAAVPVAPNRYWVDWFWGTQFIVIFKPLFQKILDYDFKDTDAADLLLSAMAKDCMVMYPFISVQKNFGYSDINDAYNQDLDLRNNINQQADYRLAVIHHIAHKFNKRSDTK